MLIISGSGLPENAAFNKSHDTPNSGIWNSDGLLPWPWLSWWTSAAAMLAALFCNVA